MKYQIIFFRTILYYKLGLQPKQAFCKLMNFAYGKALTLGHKTDFIFGFNQEKTNEYIKFHLQIKKIDFDSLKVTLSDHDNLKLPILIKLLYNEKYFEKKEVPF